MLKRIMDIRMGPRGVMWLTFGIAAEIQAGMIYACWRLYVFGEKEVMAWWLMLGATIMLAVGTVITLVDQSRAADFRTRRMLLKSYLFPAAALAIMAVAAITHVASR